VGGRGERKNKWPTLSLPPVLKNQFLPRPKHEPVEATRQKRFKEKGKKLQPNAGPQKKNKKKEIHGPSNLPPRQMEKDG